MSSSPDVVIGTSVNGITIDMSAPSGGDWLIYTDTPATETIARITFNTPTPLALGAEVVTLRLTSDEVDAQEFPPNPLTFYDDEAAFGIGKVDQGPHDLVLKGSSKTLGQVICSGLANYDADFGFFNSIEVQDNSVPGINTRLRSLTGNIENTASLTMETGNLVDLNIDGDVLGPITIEGGFVDTIDIEGDLLANILAENGGLRVLDVAGNIGANGSSVEIKWRGQSSNNGPDSPTDLITANNAYADFTALNAGSWISDFKITNDFVGNMNIASFVELGDTSIFEVGGTFSGKATFVRESRSDLKFNNKLPAGTLIRYQRNIDEAKVSQLNFDFEIGFDGGPGGTYEGIEGLIIVNEQEIYTEDDTDDDGQPTEFGWNPTVSINIAGRTLSPIPFYDQTAGQIGSFDGSTFTDSGAVATVPFAVWHTSCFPEHTAILPDPSGLGAVMRFYGPVTWTGAGKPVIVERRAACDDTAPLVDVSSLFTVTRDPANPAKLFVYQTAGWDSGF